MRRAGFAAIFLHFAPIMVGTLLVVAAAFGDRLIRPAPWAIVAIAAVSAVVSGASVAAFAGRGAWRRLGAASVPAILALSGSGLLLLIEARAARTAFAAGVAGLLALFAVHVRRAHALRSIGGDASEVERLCDAIRIVSMFCAFAFGFGAAGFLAVPTVALSAAVGVIGGVTAYTSLGGTAGKDSGVLALSAAVVAAEAHAMGSLLPTSYATNAAVATVLFWFLLSVFRHAAVSVSDDRFLRRHAAVAAMLVVAVLATSRWA